MNPRILLLSYAFPPVALPEALLSAKRLGNVSGFDVDVICVQPAGTDIRIDRSLDSYVSSRFSRIERVEVPAVLRTLVGRNINGVFQIPGLFHLMNRRAIQAATTLRPERYAAIVSWSQWHSIHLAGLALKRKYPDIPWIAHFSDPWTDNPFVRYGRLMRSYNRWLETQVHDSADVLSFTSHETIDLVFSGTGGANRAKAIELPHSFEPELYPEGPLRKDGPLLLRSLGNFYGPRSPEPLFQALAILRQRAPALLDEMRVELIGQIPSEHHTSPALRALPAACLLLKPSVDYKTSLALMRSSDLLLNIDAPFEQSVFLPSKLVDYIGAERPIFGITPAGTASRIIRRIGGWVAEPKDPHAIAVGLESALMQIRQCRGIPWGDPEVRLGYAASTVAAKFNDLIRSFVWEGRSRLGAHN